MKDLRCIDPDVGKLIGYYETGNLKGGDRDRFEIHLVNCTYCFNETFQLQPAIARLRVKTPAVVTQISREQARPKTSLPEGFFSLRDSRPWAGLALLFLATTAAIYIYLAKQPRDRADMGPKPANALPRIQNLSPTGALKAPPSELRWSAMAKAVRYEVSLVDEGKTLWKEQTAANRISVPAYVRAGLRAGVQYTWQVQVPQAADATPIRETATFTILTLAQSEVPLGR